MDRRRSLLGLAAGHAGAALVEGADELLAYARDRFVGQAIVVGHAGHPTVTTVYGQLLDLIAERELRTDAGRRLGDPGPAAAGRGASGRVARQRDRPTCATARLPRGCR